MIYLFCGIQCDTWFGVWQFVLTKIAFSGMSCLYFFYSVSLLLKWSIIYDSLCCSWSRAMSSLNQDLSTICLNKSKKKPNKGKRAQRFINFFLSKTYELRMMSTFVRSLRQSIQKTRNLSLYESGLGIHTPGLSLWLPWREGKIRFWEYRILWINMKSMIHSAYHPKQLEHSSLWLVSKIEGTTVQHIKLIPFL